MGLQGYVLAPSDQGFLVIEILASDLDALGSSLGLAERNEKILAKPTDFSGSFGVNERGEG